MENSNENALVVKTFFDKYPSDDSKTMTANDIRELIDIAFGVNTLGLNLTTHAAPYQLKIFALTEIARSMNLYKNLALTKEEIKKIAVKPLRKLEKKSSDLFLNKVRSVLRSLGEETKLI
jgi:hypothetical protein